MAAIDSLVSAEWLYRHLNDPAVKVFDGTWVLPGDESDLPEGYIRGAQFFDIDVIASPSDMAHMLPSREVFDRHMSNFGVNAGDQIIVYDRHGFFSAPRVWWTFKMFGHDNVAVLNGGLPAWIDAGYPVQAQSEERSETTYKSQGCSAGVMSAKEIASKLPDRPVILDARPEGRFTGQTPEPREGLRSGRIAGSLNLPLSRLKTPDGMLRPDAALRNIVATFDLNPHHSVITSCGSGITAAGLAFVLDRLGFSNIAVYDGSWTEWGASDLPIETGPADYG